MTPNEIQNKTFEKKMGGFKAEEVTAYLADLADYVQDLLDEKEELMRKMSILAEKIEEYREDEDSLRAALIGAQKLGDSVVRDAKKKAEMLLAEATVQAEDMMTDATIKAEDMVNDAKNSIDKEAIALTRIQGQVTEFKAQILDLYQQHIEMISAIPDEPELPRDVKKIVEGVSAEVIEFSSQKKVEAAGELAVSVEEEESPESQRSGGQKYKPRGDYGNLRFGEEYNLTRND